MNTRALATQLIYKVLTKGHSLTHALPAAKSQCHNKKDAAFVQALAFGVIRWYPKLNFLIKQILKKPIKPKDFALQYLIAVGLYQLLDLQTPPHAAISETVAAARDLKKPWATGLVNAALQTYLRQAATLQNNLLQDEEAYYAHPQWLINTIRKDWPIEWKNILTANNALPPQSLRINHQKTTREQYLQYLQENGFAANPLSGTTAGIMITPPVEVTMLPGFQAGLFSVQDGAAQYAAVLLDLQPNLRVLDACAAPGGKTTHILETEPQLAAMIALDISPVRTQVIMGNLTRLQLKATVITADATKPHSWWDGKLFDRILLDAPCSATGIIRRHPDIKYLRTLADVTKLTQTQLQLLNTLWPLLAPNGILVYATCSILSEENWQMMQNFLQYHTDARSLPLSLPCGIPQYIGYQLLPGQSNMDGFYYARIRKLPR